MFIRTHNNEYISLVWIKVFYVDDEDIWADLGHGDTMIVKCMQSEEEAHEELSRMMREIAENGPANSEDRKERKKCCQRPKELRKSR